jgi:hypothetical protein
MARNYGMSERKERQRSSFDRAHTHCIFLFRRMADQMARLRLLGFPYLALTAVDCRVKIVRGVDTKGLPSGGQRFDCERKHFACLCKH